MNKFVQCCIGGMLVAAASGSVFAQGFPQRPINFLIGFAPAGISDRIARYVAKSMSKNIGQPITVENRAGADGTIAVNGVVRAAADGYTMGQLCGGAVVSEAIGTQVPYDMYKDLAFVGTTSYTDTLIVARPGLPANNLREMIEYARKEPGKVTIGLVTIARNIVPLVYLTKQAGVSVTFVPYKGEAPAANDAIAGTIDAAIVTPGSIREQVRAGRVKPIVMLGSTRNPLFPALQSVGESGLQSLPLDENFCLVVVPAATPADIAQKLNGAVNTAMKDPELVTAYQNDGARIGGGTQEEARASALRLRSAWQQVGKVMDITPYK